MVKRLLFTVSVIFISVTFFVSGVRADRIDFPNPVGYVNDFADILTNEDELNDRLEKLDEEEGTQIFVITTEELPREVTLESFIPRLTDNNPEWAAGTDEFDNGVIFTIVTSDRSMRIDVGYGLEGALPDIVTKHIQDDYVRPEFREGDYNAGVEAGVDKIIQAVQGEYSVEDVEREQELDEAFGMFFGPTFVCMMVFFFIFLPYLAAYLGRTKSWWLGGVIGAVVGLAFGGWMATFAVFGILRFMGLIAFPLVLGPLGLLFDYILSKNYKKRKKAGRSTGFFSSWGGFSSGGSSGGFSSGGGGGGFSGGGGGSFGGGGSSSGW